MDNITTGSQEADKSLISVVFGFLGVTAAFLLLPKTVKYFIRRFVFGILSEIVAVVLTGLLTEKLIDYVSEHREPEDLPEPPRHR